MKKINYNFNKKAFAGYNIDNNIRIRSSSGGVFTALANIVIENRRSGVWSNV